MDGFCNWCPTFSTQEAKKGWFFKCWGISNAKPRSLPWWSRTGKEYQEYQKGKITVALKQNQTRKVTIFWEGDLGFLKVQVTTNGVMHRKFLGGQDRKIKTTGIFIEKKPKTNNPKTQWLSTKKLNDLNCYLSIAVKLFVTRFLASSSKTKTIFIGSCEQMRLKPCVTESLRLADVLWAVWRLPKSRAAWLVDQPMRHRPWSWHVTS